MSTGSPETGQTGAAPRARLRPTTRGWVSLAAAAVCLGFGLWASYPGLVGLGVALVVLLIAALAGVLTPAPVRVRRTVRPARVERLAQADADITVTNASTWMTVNLTGHDTVGGTQVPFDVPALAPGATSSSQVPIPTHRRGVVEFGPLTLHRTSLVHLLRTSGRHGSRTSALVEPRILDALDMPAGQRRGHAGADEQIAQGGTDLVGLREYVAGDDLRRLHWATSARRGTLMVREDADPSAPHLTVLLDDDAAAYTGEEFEEAVDVAASLLATAAGAECPARLLTTSGQVDLDVPAPNVGAGPARLDPGVLGELARISTAQESLPRAVFASSPDILVIISGSESSLPEHVATAAGAPVGVVAVVEPAPQAQVSAAGQVVVLRGPRAEDLVNGWRQAVAR